MNANYQGRCERLGNTSSNPTESCIDAMGIGFFSNLRVNNVRAFILGETFVGPSSGVGPGPQTSTLFIADTAGDDDSMMISDLGRFNTTNQFEPADKTTLRGVCAGNGSHQLADGSIPADGEFYACALPNSPILNCPLTFTDPESRKIYPVIDVEGTCWFGDDLVRNQVSATNAAHVYDFMNDSLFDLSSDAGSKYIDLLADIVFVKENGVKKVIASSSNYLSSNGVTLPGGEHSGYDDNVVLADTYRSIDSSFRNYLLNTCGWTTSNMESHTWGTDENFYIVDLEVAQHHTTHARMQPTYNIVCRTALDNGSGLISLTEASATQEEFFDLGANLHVSVYTVNEPYGADITSETSGVFVNIEDISDYTCPAGWHVPRQNEWTDLITAVGNDAAIGTDMKFTITNDSGLAAQTTNHSSPVATDGSRYYARDLIVDGVTSVTSAGTWNDYDVRLPGYDVTPGATVGFNAWSKEFNVSRTFSWAGPYFALVDSPKTRIFAAAFDLVKVKVAHALLGSVYDSNLAKIRCVQGEELTASTAGWDACAADLGPSGGESGHSQTYNVISCTIGGFAVDHVNCANPYEGTIRSCIPSSVGNGSTVQTVNTSIELDALGSSASFDPNNNWYTGDWGSCTAFNPGHPLYNGDQPGDLGFKTRTVQCQTGDGSALADSACVDVKPATEEGCVL